MSSGQLLSRLLLVATPALAAPVVVACSSRDRPMPGGSGGRVTTSTATATASVDTSGMRIVKLATPPLTPKGPVPVLSARPAASEKAYALCGDSYRSWPLSRSGGPYASPVCYQPVAPVTGCLEATAPGLPRALNGFGDCAFDGPFAQTDQFTGKLWCCYNVGWMGIGRPLVVDERPAQATLRREAGWG